MLEQGNPTDGLAESSQAEAQQPSLSEISHLFLTGLRERHAGGTARPSRKPPGTAGRPAVSIDIAPREFNGETLSEEDAPRPRMSAVLGHHLGAGAVGRVQQYARQVAVEAGRVGLIELNDQGIRLSCYDASPLGGGDSKSGVEEIRPEPVDAKRIRQAIEEMSWDIDRWIVFLADGPASPRARKLLGEVRHWTLMATADDAGVVAAYRALKAVAGIGTASVSAAVLGAEDAAHERIIQRKLAGASRQFLHRPVEAEGAVSEAKEVSEHVVLWCRAGSGTAGEHWTAVSELAARSMAPADQEPAPERAMPVPESLPQPAAAPEPEVSVREQVSAPAATMRITPMETPVQSVAASAATRNSESIATEVLELPASYDSAAILAAVVKRHPQWIACPLRPPMCAASCVAVDRSGRLHLLACGLAELRAVSRGYGWLAENRELVKMAVPQMNIDPGAQPHLTLFVDQADMDADQLGAILRSGHVTIQTYRRLRWGERTGLLLEAA